jgi:iron complex outermembrane receptor protein
MFRVLLFLIVILSPFTIFAQNVTGILTDATSSESIIGANILVKGSDRGTISDIDGRYTIRADIGDTLIFSYTGFETREVIVTSTTLNLQLREAAFELNEIVVIGYGTTTVKDATGSLSTVSERDFNKGNIVTPENLLNGRVAGVTINTGGAPGSGSTIRIRGGSSLGASNDPLIVINGLPISNSAVGGSRSVLSSINPNDIKSFTVLKDASATAIYGSRASNGVILITTKSGGQKTKIRLSSQLGFSSLPTKLDIFTGDEFRDLIMTQRPDLVGRLGTANTDWQEEIYEDVVFNNHNLSVEGSLFGNIPARVSVGVVNQPGLRLTSEFKRNSGSLNLSPSFFDDKLKISFNANASIEKNRFASGQEGNAITFDPTQPVYDENSPFGGFFEYYADNGDGVFNTSDLVSNSPGNPVAALLQRTDKAEVNRYYGNLKFDYQLPFVDGLTAVINLGLDDSSADGFTLTDTNSRTSQPNGQFLGSETNYTNDQKNVLFDGYLAYKKPLSGKIDFDLTGGYSYQKFEASGFFSGELRNDQPDSEPINSAQTDLVLLGLFGRANFSIDDKYLFTFSVRRDATSRFSEKNRWGTFPAAAFAWRMREDFFPDSDLLTNLKLRVGWGITGQQDIGSGAADLYLERYVQGQPSSQYIFGNEIIPIAFPQFRNEDLKWEETATYNIGLDFGLTNKFNGTLEYFYKESKDLLAFAAISDGSNFSNSGFQNIGNFTSQGIEFGINYDLYPTQDRDFGWNVGFNTTVIKTKIEELALDQDVRTGGIAGGTGGTIQLHRVGYAPFKFFVYKQVYDENNNPIEGAYLDLNGDNIINDDDRYLHRNNAPEVTLGFQNSFSYKNFDLSFNLRASIGNYIYNNVGSTRAQYDNLLNVQVLSNLSTSVLESNFNTTPTVLLSDYYMENGSFLRMDNINIGYNLNNAIGSGRDVRLSAGLQNAFTITNYSGLDPEIFSGIDNTIYPRARTILFGLDVNF